MFSALFTEVINLAFVGHLNSESMLAGVGLANMFLNITTVSVMMGLNQALNTLVAQSYGMEDYYMCGVFFNRARILVSIVMMPLAIILYNTETIFGLMGFDYEASHQAQLYIYLMIPAVYILGLCDANRRLLSCMGYQNIPMAIQLISTFLHIFWCWLLTDKMGMGIKGPGLANIITNLVNLVAVHIYTKRFTDTKVSKEAYIMPTRECFDLVGLLEYMKLGLPSIGMVCMEWSSFEIMTIYSAYIGVTATATQIVILNTEIITFMATMGLQYAAQTLISNQLGAQQVNTAMRSRKFIKLVGYMTGLTMGLFIFFFRNFIAEFYTSLDEVQQEADYLFKYLAFFHIIDSSQGINQGLIRGLGKYNLLTYSALIGYFVISLPMEYIFGFALNLGLIGLWIGQTVGITCHLLCTEYLLFCHYDWHQVARDIKESHDKEVERIEMVKQGRKKGEIQLA
ncbi:hypothetical protein FGO68_gene194 [Halteria grandinella]|uniref:Uncharacterized protein n=1 Tax=Halteria grandinella TaxID=5974 RepID=A0A8J8NPI2_HALGN|nr:hypothetical protein FGO68_gene194 [Halteria grandinella]